MNRQRTCKKPFISLSGIIGGGKTTLAENIGKCMEIPVHKEDIQDKEILDLFYKDMEKWAFPLQVQLLTDRLKQQHQIAWSNEGAVQDRSIYEDLIFVQTLVKMEKLSQVEANIYEDMFEVVSATMKHPSCIVYLKVEPKIALERIKKRGREIEGGTITLEYLELLAKHYDEFFEDISHQLPVIQVDWDEFVDPEKIVEEISLALGNMSFKHVIDTKKLNK